MAHWEHRPEAGWKEFEFNQPYAKGLQRLRDEVLAKTDFDPATLWQWGTMQAMAVIEILKACERLFGAAGQQAVAEALHRVGHDVGRQVLAGTRRPPGMSDAEYMSFFATVINRIVYASLEDARIESPEQVSFDILWCPHQDHYQAFDCRVQRYFVQGMLDALREHGASEGFEVRFDSTIPAGAETCHFTAWRKQDEGTSAAQTAWQATTAFIDAKALRLAAEAGKASQTLRP